MTDEFRIYYDEILGLSPRMTQGLGNSKLGNSSLEILNLVLGILNLVLGILV